MLQFGFIGFGQAGGSFVQQAKTFGYPVLAVNTATIDLETLHALSPDEKVHIPGYEGAGKDREVGEEAFVNHREMIIRRMDELFRECQVLFPVFSLGGGTGSGMVNVAMEALTSLFDTKVICPILFFPSPSESPRHHMNALEAFSSFSRHEGMGTSFLFDNHKIHQLRSTSSLKDKFEQHHNDFLGLLHRLNEKTDHPSLVSSIDKMDLLTVLAERGAGILADSTHTEEQLLDAAKLKEQLVSSWLYTAVCDGDLHSFSRALTCLDVPENLTHDLVFDATLQSIGTPLELFTGIYESDDIRSIHLVTGLSYPVSVVKELEASIRKKEERLLETQHRNERQHYEVNDSWKAGLRKKKKITL